MEYFPLETPKILDRGIRFTILKSQSDSTKIQRRKKGVPIRFWILQFARDEVDAELLWDFYIARDGSGQAFYFIDKGVTYQVTFKDDTLTQSDFYAMVFEFGITIVEDIPSTA